MMEIYLILLNPITKEILSAWKSVGDVTLHLIVCENGILLVCKLECDVCILLRTLRRLEQANHFSLRVQD